MRRSLTVHVSRILSLLRTDIGITARELARHLQEEKAKVNSQLYKLQTLGEAVRDANFRWFLASLGRETGSAKGPSKPNPTATTCAGQGLKTGTLYKGNLPAKLQNRMTKPSEIVWTEEQTLIINAPPDARILVEAGPGTGKTAVACARVAHLLRQEVNPSAIMMVSFTRTAVAEMRSRIQLWSGEGLVSSVNITTLDSAAFRFGMGCGAQYEKLMGSFEGNIENALKSFEEKNGTLLEYLARFEHIILDEAQDLTGPRTKLAALLLEHLGKHAGVTVFADRAQAIYGFTNDLDDKASEGENFLADYPFTSKGFAVRKLEKIHRTGDKFLLEFFSSARKAVFDETVSVKALPEHVVKTVKGQGSSVGHEIQKIPVRNGDLVLYRKRVSALMAAQFQEGPVRFRLPGYPAAVFAWVGLVLSEWTEPEISAAQFNERWKNKVPAELNQGWSADRAWQLLLEHARAPKERVDVRKLRGLVARSRPPVELCRPDYGDLGPIFSTIHASKGREADRVFLMLPWKLDYVADGDIDPEEEARVYYVGATRVKKEFFHGVALSVKYACKLDNGRDRVIDPPFQLKKPVKFQFGLAGDVDETAGVSREWCLCPSEKSAQQRQADLISLWRENSQNLKSKVEVTAKNMEIQEGGQRTFRYQLFSNGKLLGWTGQSLGWDLFEAGKITKGRTKAYSDLLPPEKLHVDIEKTGESIGRMRLIGLRTCALPLDAAAEGAVHEPYATSGFFLAPMVVGLAMFYFKFGNLRR